MRALRALGARRPVPTAASWRLEPRRGLIVQLGQASRLLEVNIGAGWEGFRLRGSSVLFPSGARFREGRTQAT